MRRSHSPLRTAALCATALATAHPVGAQAQAQPQADEIAATVARFQQARDRVVADELTRYEAELSRLERESAAAGDYRTARLAQVERMSLAPPVPGDGTVPEQASTPGAAGTPAAPDNVSDPRATRLAPTAAGLAGGTTLAKQDGAITGWAAAGSDTAAATWRLPDGWPGGGFTITLQYSASGAGELRFAEDHFTLERELAPTAGDQPTAVELGTLKMSEGATALRIETSPDRAPPDLRVLGITLRPNRATPTRREPNPP